MRELIRLIVLVLVVSLSVSCGPRRAASPTEDAASRREVLSFSLPGPEGQLIRSDELRGRVTVLLFLTTFDIASQAQARRLEDLYRTHSPRINALGIVVEAPRYSDLVGEYRESLGLSYELVMGERQVLDEHPILRRVQAVPAWIILNRDGAVDSSASGALSLDELEDLVRGAESK